MVSVPVEVQPLLQDIGRIADQAGTPAYAVGGCVRDWLLGLMNTEDLDVVVVPPPASPPTAGIRFADVGPRGREAGGGVAVAEAAARRLGGRVTVHPQFGTAAVLAPWTSVAQHLSSTRRAVGAKTGVRPPRPGSLRIDVASARKETYVRPAAYPRVSAGTLEEDLSRRDFTINAMAVALAFGQFGTLIDPFGGRQDLHRQELHMLHPRSFLDDPSRILRGLRFGQRFGFRWEPQTERAMKEALAAGALGWLNAGRLQKELDRMTREPNPRRCFDALAALLDAAR